MVVVMVGMVGMVVVMVVVVGMVVVMVVVVGMVVVMVLVIIVIIHGLIRRLLGRCGRGGLRCGGRSVIVIIATARRHQR